MELSYEITWEHKGLNIYHFLRTVLPRQDRRLLRELLASGAVSVNAGVADPGRPLAIGDVVIVKARRETLPERRRDMSRLAVLYEDESVLAIDKPCGLAAAKERLRRGDSALDRLRAERVSSLTDERVGLRLVHRLDRETSGVLVFAKGRTAKKFLTEQFVERRVEKEYWALVVGHPLDEEGLIQAPIAPSRRGPSVRIVSEGGKDAATQWRVVERFRGFSRLDVRPLTGRTHQIRVHLAHVGFPVLGDRRYGGGESLYLSALKPGYRPRRGETEPPVLSRLALHASRIRLVSPDGARAIEITSPLPPELERVVRVLRKYATAISTRSR
ncbi:MAG: RluA family pseudouridine synthase [Planctomycetota bacterium]